MNKPVLVLAVALLLTLGASVFATGVQEKAPASPAVATTDPAAQTLTVWEYFSVQSQVQELKDLAVLFNKTNPSVRVDYVFVPYDQMTTKVVAAAAAGTGPDVVLYNGPTIGELVDAGALADMAAEWQSFADKSQFGSGVVHDLNGKIYGVQGYVNLLGLWYNQDLLGKIGVQAPKSIDQLTAGLQKAKAAGYTGITLTGKPNDQGEWQAYPWLSAYGWDYGNPQVSAAEKTFSVISSWAQDGYLPRITVTWGQAEPFQSFLVGNVAFAENGNWQLGSAQSSAKFSYGVTRMPSGTMPAKVYLGGEVESIGAFAKNPQLAWEYLAETYFSKEGQLIALKDVGSIPSRADAASDPAITSSPYLSPFAYEVQNQGETYPPAVGPVNKVRNAELAVAQQWSSVIAGYETASAAATKAVSGVNSELSQ